MDKEAYRSIPPVNAIASLVSDRTGDLLSPDLALSQARHIQSSIRHTMEQGSSDSPTAILDDHLNGLEYLLSSRKLKRVLNGTGIIVHTNLGRAPVSEATANAMCEAAAGSVALEIDAVTGQRGGRMRELSDLLTLLTAAEQSLVVNNNAGAVLLALTALAGNRRVAVSRSEAVEIGGGFRIPDVLAQSGATLIEVGTTNRTYSSDFARAAADGADVFLRIHPSNFSIQGFVAAPALTELRAVADDSGATLIEDLGSGTLVRTEEYGIDHEPTVQESIAAGVDIVTYSGDKLLGGPQAGVIAGRKDLIDQIASHPLARAVRADKSTLAGLSETLRHYVRGDFESAIPVWNAISASADSLKSRAEHVISMADVAGQHLSTISTVNYVGGGALPGQSLLGWAIRITTHSSGSATSLAKSLRLALPIAVYSRIEDDAVNIELRTISAQDDALLAESLRNALAQVKR